MKADIPVQESEKVQEARAQRSRVKLSEQKEESHSLLDGGGAPPVGGGEERHQEKVMPVKSDKFAGRNDKVNVQYTDGRVLRDVKYKKVEEDVINNKCIIID